MTTSSSAGHDVFIADTNIHRVVEIPSGGGTATTVASGLGVPFGVAVDGAGNVYIADGTAGVDVIEIPAGGGPQSPVGSGFSAPTGVAVDVAGDVFVADYGNDRAVEVPAGGGPQITLGSGLSSPSGVAVDAAGDLFIVDLANNRVVELPAGGGPQVTVAPGLNMPFGVAVDVPVVHSTYGAPVQLTAAVQTSPAGGITTGSVDFADGSTNLGTATLSLGTSVSATLTTSVLSVGTHRITATYGGDSSHAASLASSPITVVVDPGLPTTPTITNVPSATGVGSHFEAVVTTTGDGATSVTSNSPGVCTAVGVEIVFVGAGTCSLTAHVAATNTISSPTAVHTPGELEVTDVAPAPVVVTTASK